ncbi:hypothetical protein ABIA32_000503 [Streptacidiphilus sp. MAP12-20]|uniref:hypothetical protein n=1 Tax=Streptacidiphilus sp. MAP12-20 TaxID=3156299 RepID=UPI003517680E
MKTTAREDLLRWAGLALGALAAVWAAGQGQLGIGPLLAPTLLGVGAVLGALGADATAPGPTGAVRVAELTPRRFLDFLTRRTVVALGCAGALLVSLLVLAAATASPDDLGRTGRAFGYACGEVSVLRSPWPGTYYSLPLAAVLGAATLACGLTLRRMARRPGVDESWRRRSAARVAAAWGLMVTASLAGVSLAMAGALSGLPCAASGTLDAASWALGAVATGAGVAALACGIALSRRS